MASIQDISAILSKKERLTNNVFSFDFTLVSPASFSFVPGQYLIMSVPQNDSQIIKRLYSIASPSFRNDGFSLLVHIVPDGKASTFLSSLAVGTKIAFRGPAGVFCLRKNNLNKIFVATGTGIAPIWSIIQSEITKNIKTILFFGITKAEDVYLFDELKQYAQNNPLFSFFICLSREKDLSKIKEADRKHFTLGHVNDGINTVLGVSAPGYDYYLCGGRETIGSLRLFLASLAIPSDQICFERF